MVAGRRRGLRTAAAEAKEQKQDVIRAINNCLDSKPVDLEGLRQIAVLQGFVNNQLRAKVWPVLLGIEEASPESAITAAVSREHRDSHVVECDIQRSLWAFTEGWSDEERNAKREDLRGVLASAVTQEDQEVYYYQGLHDIAAVLLFVTGQHLAAALLVSLATTHLRDFTRSSLDAALELLSLMPTLLFQTDEALAKHIQQTGIPPFYALSWLITWFSHTVQDLTLIARTFDVLLASHPLMPLYFCASVLKCARHRILLEDDPSEMHRLLTNLPVFHHRSVEEVAIDAAKLFKQLPPDELVRKSRLRLQMATAMEAKLEDGRWSVPEKKYTSLGLIPRQMALSWLDWMARSSDKENEKQWQRIRRQIKPMRTLVGGAVLISSGLIAMYASQAWH